MKRLLSYFILILLIFPALAMAEQKASFQAGKDYQVISNPVKSLEGTNGKVTVVQFFNYGCPFCFHTEPTLEKWLKDKPAYVEFSRIPVAFKPSWQILSKAYYVAEALNVEPKITPALFDAIHVQGLDVTDEQVLEKFFNEYGVSNKNFEDAFNQSPKIDAEMAKGNKIMREYKIVAIPSFVINGEYKTDLAMTRGNTKKLIAVVAYLVNKSEQQG